ncbi:MAG: lysophospholipase L1-like esterase [Psychromonas sp.]|jgi:lysophospholipase L1-like esterase
MKIKSIILISIFSLIGATNYAQKVEITEGLQLYCPPSVLRLDSSYIPHYPLVDFDQNYFRFYSSKSDNWQIFYNKLIRMEKEKKDKLNLYHIGGSHVQADIYTHDVRTFLQTKNKAIPGERGWVFPFDLAKTNNPWNYEFKSDNSWTSHRVVVSSQRNTDYGTLGAKITCDDSLIGLVFKYDMTDHTPNINKVRIYHNKGEFPFEFQWAENEILFESQYTDTTVGYTEVKFLENFIDFDVQMSRMIEADYELEIYGFQLLNDDPGISYNSIGINGAGLYSYLACNRFREQLKTYPPDFFAFSVGTNDGNVPYSSFDPMVYKANLKKMMLWVYEANPNCAILLTVPNDSYYRRRYLNENIGREREVIEELAREFEVPVWDLYGLMGELGSSKKWYLSGLMKSDMVHFSKEGYHLKGDLFFDAFEKYIREFRELKSIKTDGGIR